MNLVLPEWLKQSPALLRHPRLPDVSALVLGVIALYSAALLSWQLLGLVLPADEASGVVVPGQVNTARRTANEIAGLSLFGGQTATTPYGSTSMMDAPDTQLNLKLLGIIASSNPNIARAIIAAGGGQENYYAIGASLPGGAVIRAIYDDRVILEYNGRYEALRMPKQILAIITPSPKKDKSPAPTTDADRIQHKLSDTEIKDYQQRLLNNPSSLIGELRIRRVIENDQIKGYRLYPGKNPPLFEKLGLKAGDLVTSINGQSVRDTVAMTNLYSQMGSLSEVRVEIERNGQKKFIQLPLNR